MFSPETALRLQAVTEAHVRPAQPEEEAQKLPKASVTAPERKEKPQKPVQAARVPLGKATVLNSLPWPPPKQSPAKGVKPVPMPEEIPVDETSAISANLAANNFFTRKPIGTLKVRGPRGEVKARALPATPEEPPPRVLMVKDEMPPRRAAEAVVEEATAEEAPAVEAGAMEDLRRRIEVQNAEVDLASGAAPAVEAEAEAEP